MEGVGLRSWASQMLVVVPHLVTVCLSIWWNSSDRNTSVCVVAQKTALIVYAHQSSASFNAAARDVAVQELEKQGYKVTVSDLYAMSFRASATQDDIIGEYAARCLCDGV